MQNNENYNNQPPGEKTYQSQYVNTEIDSDNSTPIPDILIQDLLIWLKE